MVGGSTPVLAAAPFKWATLLGAQPTVPHFLEEFALEAAAAPTAAASGSAGGRCAGMSGEVRRQQLMSEVSGVISNLLGTGEGGPLGCQGQGCQGKGNQGRGGGTQPL